MDCPRDPKDSPFLVAALTVKADFIISGDNDLLVLGLADTTKIVTVADFALRFAIE